MNAIAANLAACRQPCSSATDDFYMHSAVYIDWSTSNKGLMTSYSKSPLNAFRAARYIIVSPSKMDKMQPSASDIDSDCIPIPERSNIIAN